MPGKKHLSGVGKKEQRMYEKIKKSGVKTYGSVKKAKQVAAATVRKHHAKKGHKKGQ